MPLAASIGPQQEDTNMKWSTPEYSDVRFGFEVTMYINNK